MSVTLQWFYISGIWFEYSCCLTRWDVETLTCPYRRWPCVFKGRFLPRSIIFRKHFFENIILCFIHSLVILHTDYTDYRVVLVRFRADNISGPSAVVTDIDRFESRASVSAHMWFGTQSREAKQPTKLTTSKWWPSSKKRISPQTFCFNEAANMTSMSHV